MSELNPSALHGPYSISEKQDGTDHSNAKNPFLLASGLSLSMLPRDFDMFEAFVKILDKKLTHEQSFFELLRYYDVELSIL